MNLRTLGGVALVTAALGSGMVNSACGSSSPGGSITGPSQQPQYISGNARIASMNGAPVNTTIRLGGKNFVVNNGNLSISLEDRLTEGVYSVEIPSADSSFISRKTPALLNSTGLYTDLGDGRRLPLEVFDISSAEFDTYARVAFNYTGSSPRYTKPVTFLIYDKTVWRREGNSVVVDNTNGMRQPTLDNCIIVFDEMKALLDKYIPGSKVVLESEIGNAPDIRTLPEGYFIAYSDTNPLFPVANGINRSPDGSIRNSIIAFSHSRDISRETIRFEGFENMGFNDLGTGFIYVQNGQITPQSLRFMEMKYKRKTNHKSEPGFPDSQF